MGRGVAVYVQEVEQLMRGVGLSESWIAYLICADSVGRKSGWRLLMMSGAVPALLTFFIRLFVPESHRWENERRRGARRIGHARSAGSAYRSQRACGK